MKIWIASDSTKGRMFDAETPEKIDPIKIAYEYGHAEGGEIIHIWKSDNTELFPDYEVYWDTCRRKYRKV